MQGLLTEMVTLLAALNSTIKVLPPPPRPVEQTVTMTLRDPNRKPVDGLDVQIEIRDPNSRVIETVTKKTGEKGPGSFTLLVKKFPSTLQLSVLSKEWRVTRPTQALVALKGSEGSRVAFQQTSPTEIEASRALTFQGGKKPPQKTPPKKTPPKPAVPETLKLAFTAPDVEVEREFADLTIKGANGTEVFYGSELLGNADPETGLKLLLPEWQFSDGKANLFFRRESAGAIFTGYAPAPKLDPYKVTEFSIPNLALTAINRIEVAKVAVPEDGLMTGNLAQRLYGKPQFVDDKGKKVNKAFIWPDGSTWWQYPTLGIALKVRSIVDREGRDFDVVERFRLLSPDGGNVAGLKVGSSGEERRAILGEGTVALGRGEEGTYTFMANSIVTKDTNGKIEWIEIRRPISAIKRGVDPSPFFKPVKLFLPQVQGSLKDFDNAGSLLTRWFSELPGIDVVDDRSKSDFVLDITLDELVEKKDKMIELVPFKVESTVRLKYRLIDAITDATPRGWNDEPLQETSAIGSAKADYEREVRDGSIIFAVLAGTSTLIKDPLARGALEIAIGISAASAAENMRKTMVRASDRTRVMALRRAAQEITSKLNAAARYRVDVVDVDRKNGIVTLGAGRDQGIREGMEFVLYNGRDPVYGNDDEPLKQKQVIARVTELGNSTTACQLYLVERSVSRQMRENVNEAKLNRSLDKILDPTTGFVNARFILRDLTGS